MASQPGRRHTHVETELGRLLLVADGERICGIYFPAHTYPPEADSIGPAVESDRDELLATAASELREYLAGTRREFTVPTAAQGDAFNQRVWERLRQIPYGSTITYGAIATELGSPGLAQRVGQAVGHNPISIMVPCHRVVGADGSLTGFAGGLARKRHLLELEEPESVRAERLF